MTDDEYAGYCSVILIYLARRASGRTLAVPRKDVDRLISEQLKRTVDAKIVRRAVRILNQCDISYTEDDIITGAFVRVSAASFENFISSVVSDQARYNRYIQESDDATVGISRAESRNYFHLELYNKYDSIRKYSQFGDDWAEAMMRRLRESLESQEIVPASDRLVLRSDNQDELDEIVREARSLKERLTTSNDLGGLSAQQAQAASGEVAQLEAAFSADVVRARPTYERARETLSWIAQQAGAAVIGAAALALLTLIAKVLGF